jgi:hypothetical protein
MARQGQAFATAQEVRVVFPPAEDIVEGLVDVPRDGKTVGEIVTRGNIVMKEVGAQYQTTALSMILSYCCNASSSTSAIPRQHRRLFVGVASIQVTWPLCSPTGVLLSWIGVRTSSSQEERFVFLNLVRRFHH